MPASEERKNAAEVAKELGISRSYVSRIEKRRLRFTCASVPGTNPICAETKTNVQAFYMRNISPNFKMATWRHAPFIRLLNLAPIGAGKHQ
ncbi:sigma factor-like helix-turn-helix DNA-binding protein [Bacillus haynesii]|uniref:sigma factor-like helix-turn-helix DNA-binding protein n=1 Tax=Bacillus haynesii TaxID=1925021 RepID=UPI00227F6FA2|nr:helix-turn-helix domain-containing protein [Bacillus haynesii]MCY7999890.1 helix-turn-helix domain-containing protein [Bacillus haynesii]